MKRTGLVSLLLLILILPVWGQGDPARIITVTASVYDINDSLARPAPLIINRRTGTGLMAGAGSNVTITGQAQDTFLLAAGGYEMVRLCFRDSSAGKTSFVVHAGLKMKVANMAAVTIYPVKDLDEIRKEREKLGQKQTTTTNGVIDAAQSPVTFLYERFSREGRSRATVAMLENEDRRKDVLKELFRTYIRAGVIDLDESEFDTFIAYLNIPEEYLKTASDYELALAIRQRYIQYKTAQQLHMQNQR